MIFFNNRYCLWLPLWLACRGIKLGIFSNNRGTSRMLINMMYTSNAPLIMLPKSHMPTEAVQERIQNWNLKLRRVIRRSRLGVIARKQLISTKRRLSPVPVACYAILPSCAISFCLFAWDVRALNRICKHVYKCYLCVDSEDVKPLLKVSTGFSLDSGAGKNKKKNTSKMNPLKLIYLN